MPTENVNDKPVEDYEDMPIRIIILNSKDGKIEVPDAREAFDILLDSQEKLNKSLRIYKKRCEISERQINNLLRIIAHSKVNDNLCRNCGRKLKKGL